MAHHEHLGLPTVRSNDYAIGQMAARYFIERGFAHFFFGGAGDSSLAARLRCNGFRDKLGELGFKSIQSDSRFDFFSEDGVALNRILQEMPKPIGFMVSHDGIARSAAELLIHAGFAVPDQIALLGVDNDEFHCQFSQPTLSSIQVPYDDVGYQAAAILDRILSGKKLPDLPVLIAPVGVVTRQSTDIVAFDEPRVSQALRFIREKACDPCTVDDVLNTVAVSRRWLEGQFRARFGRSPHEEIIRIRMEHARQLLADPSLPLKNVAEKTGYSHLQNFVATFRRCTGQTPAVYRRSLRDATDNPSQSAE